MTKKARQYSATEKAKIVLEAIKSEMTIAQLSSKGDKKCYSKLSWNLRIVMVQ